MLAVRPASAQKPAAGMTRGLLIRLELWEVNASRKNYQYYSLGPLLYLQDKLTDPRLIIEAPILYDGIGGNPKNMQWRGRPGMVCPDQAALRCQRFRVSGSPRLVRSGDGVPHANGGGHPSNWVNWSKVGIAIKPSSQTLANSTDEGRGAFAPATLRSVGCSCRGVPFQSPARPSWSLPLKVQSLGVALKT